MIVGGYVLDLYCDSGKKQPYGTPGHEGHNTGGAETFGGANMTEAHKKAKRAGWKIYPGSRRAICPKCAEEE